MRKASATIAVTATATRARLRLTAAPAWGPVPSSRFPLRGSALGRGAEAHADAPHRVQIPRAGGALAELAPQPGQVDVDRLIVPVRLPPHLGQQFPARDHAV